MNAPAAASRSAISTTTAASTSSSTISTDRRRSCATSWRRSGNWLIVRLKGRGQNTGAIGAVVTAKSGTPARTQRRLVQSGSSYISQEDKRLHFGLGAATTVEALEVLWPDGTKTSLPNVKANQILDVQQPAK